MGKKATSRHSPYAETPARWLHIVLFAVAASGWLIFILACAGGPAWSPDGSQILFAYRDVENSRTSVAVYDRASGGFTTILTQPAPKEGDMALRPAWQKDGQRALVGIYRTVPNDSSETVCELVSIPVKSSVPLQVYNLGHMEGCVNAFPEVDGKVYFGGRDLRWVDLNTGEVGSKEFKPGIPENEGLVFSDGSGQIYYQRKATRKITAEDETGREIGRVQPEDASLKAVLTIWDNETAAHGISDLYPDLWPYGSMMALIGTTEESESDRIVIAEENKGIVRTIVAGLGSGPYRLGNLIWAPDGSRFFASVITVGDQKDTLNYGIAEIPIGDGKARLTHIASIHSRLDDDFLSLFRGSLPVSLSPDGRWIAATPAVLGRGQIEDRDRALFLIDLHDSGRTVQRVKIPSQAASSKAASSKQ